MRRRVKVDTQKADNKKAYAQKVDAQKADTKKADTKKADAQKADALGLIAPLSTPKKLGGETKRMLTPLVSIAQEDWVILSDIALWRKWLPGRFGRLPDTVLPTWLIAYWRNAL